MTTTRKTDIMLTEETLGSVTGGGRMFLCGGGNRGKNEVWDAMVEFLKDSSFMPWNWKKHNIEDEVKNRVKW